MPQLVHIVGAGLAGLSAATDLAAKGYPVSLYEATAQAGGRCRSYFDEHLGRTIDNGNHMMLSGNRSLMAYLSRIESRNKLVHTKSSRFEFYDFLSRKRWCLDFGSGMIPLALLNKANRLPGSSLRDYLDILKTRQAPRGQSVEACLSGGNEDNPSPLYEELWHPLATAILNTDPDEAQAAMLWPVIKQAFARGGSSVRPMIAMNELGGLSAALITPALEFLERRLANIQYQQRLVSIDQERGEISALNFTSTSVTVESGEQVIFAMPPWALTDVLGDIDGLKVPTEYRPIINGHFVLPSEINKITIIGLTNSLSQWVFAHGDMASVTISAAGPHMDLSNEEIAAQMWPEILSALGMEDAPLGPYRIIREKRATIAHTPEQMSKRPYCRIARMKNLILAGDWTNTGLPATIEGAIYSGWLAASAV